MRYFYVLLLILPLHVLAQGESTFYLRGELGLNSLDLERTYSYHIFNTLSSSRGSRVNQAGANRGPMASVGLTYAFHPRWQVEATTAYARGSTQDTIEIFNNFGNGELRDFTFIAPVKAWGWWSELRVFYRLNRARPWEVLLGTGLSYGLKGQTYRSGFDYDLDRELYVVQRTRREQSSAFGIPVCLRLQYPVSTRVLIGGNLQCNIFFDGDAQGALTGYVAYRL